MARRKRFGFTAPEHRRRARVEAEEFRNDMRMLKINIENGECARAFSRLKLALRTVGEFTADRRATSRSSFPRKGSMSRQIETAARKFATMCVR